MTSAYSHAILALTLENFYEIPDFLPAIAEATERTSERLLIILFSRLFNANAKLSHTGTWNEVQTLLASVYVESTRAAQKLDRILMDVDVLLKGFDAEVCVDSKDGWQGLFLLEGDSTAYPLPQWSSTLRITHLKSTNAPPLEVPSATEKNTMNPSTFPIIALGGTFDHLHSGHKILLSMAAWIAHEKVIVGVTDDKLLQKKVNKDVIEPLDLRIERVRRFMEFFKPGLVYDVVPIDDVYGPTAVDPNIQVLVVSKETLGGASAIAKLREEKKYPALECFVIDVISATSANLDSEDMEMLRQAKMSSTFIREYLVARRASKQ
ncbi:Nucleotidylyl transferase [Fomitiporia mediterranea MF3/22]|uniref:Nucleotidylyl transferase n=1 Tax=Fomitiporia mediterranea (strain MF3/22) TaxID=694068 RepID=UPI00044095C4|nr:Nucleotidylyl transferase [Fomitiporia mediterranea MF3/22]EJD05866.1 Nucleotidylyl transferase [Fomitiporia mediterranea MF3/22]